MHPVGKFLTNQYFLLKYRNSKKYWEQRYKNSGNSGSGSYGKAADYKAEFLNRFIADHQINSVIELGCGDGNQLKLLELPAYTGVDVSKTAIAACRQTFASDPTRHFYTVADKEFIRPAELAMSLDVIYHLVEDRFYEQYIAELFSLATRFVIIYAWDVEGPQRMHVRHRKFSTWIQKNITGWELMQQLSNDVEIVGSCDFFVYKKKGQSINSAT